MATENSPAPFSFPYVGTFFGTIRFLQECKMVILIMQPSEDGASFYRLIKCLSRLQRSGRFRVRKNFAFVFCGRKAFGGNIIKPGHLIRFVPFPFCYTPKQLQPAEGRF